MRPGDHERIQPVSEAVREAAAITDPDGSDGAIAALVEIYEDDDRPATAVEDLLGTLLATAEGIDLEGDEGGVEVTAAAAAWLATNPAQANGHERDNVVREAVRLAYKGKPPEQVEAWLDGRGIAA
ncbi:MAG TPA: hypothetical protein VEB65_03355 [Solirubrobacterales bacterium]|nr:hypothetical protein [Solirubrobacterales bacterium]